MEIRVDGRRKRRRVGGRRGSKGDWRICMTKLERQWEDNDMSRVKRQIRGVNDPGLRRCAMHTCGVMFFILCWYSTER
jgi:hypothetical protein